MEIQAKINLILQTLKDAKYLDKQSDIVENTLECLMKGYMQQERTMIDGKVTSSPLTSEEEFLVNEMKYYINELKK